MKNVKDVCAVDRPWTSFLIATKVVVRKKGSYSVLPFVTTRVSLCNHSLIVTTQRQVRSLYAAADAYAVMRLDDAARAQGPTRRVRPAAAEDGSS